MRWPLRTQILLPMAAVMLVTIVTVSALNAYLAARNTRQEIERQLQGVAETLGNSNFPLTSAVLQQASGLSGAEFVVVDANDGPLARSRESLTPPLASGPPTRVADLRLGEVAEVGGERFFHARVPLSRQSGSEKNASLHILYPESRWDQAWRQAVQPPLWVGGVAMIAVVALGVAIAGRVSRPIALLQNQVDRIAQGEFRPLPAPQRNDEIRDLATSVNRLAEMLAQYEDEIRRSERLKTLGQLGGGIAHQMRNLATGCRMALDLHRLECPQGDECESLAVATRQLVLMEKYLQRFLRQGDPRGVPHDELDLRVLIDRVIPLVSPAARHVGVALDWQSPEQPVLVQGDADGLEQLVVNLLLNAIDAASQSPAAASQSPAAASQAPFVGSAKVSLNLLVRNDRAQLEVRDTGRGPAESVRDRLFDPLVTEKPDGVGLGLSVVREIARQHGGDVSWQRAGNQTCFLVEFPIPPAPVLPAPLLPAEYARVEAADR